VRFVFQRTNERKGEAEGEGVRREKRDEDGVTKKRINVRRKRKRRGREEYAQSPCRPSSWTQGLRCI